MLHLEPQGGGVRPPSPRTAAPAAGLPAHLEWRRENAGKPMSQPERAAPRPALVVAAAASGFLVTLGLIIWLAGPRDRDRPVPRPTYAAERAPPPVAWVTINRPFHMFDLGGGDFGRLPLHYAARRESDGPGRQDTLVYGAAQPGGSFVKVAFHRVGRQTPASPSLFVDVARLAADSGLAIQRSGLPSMVATRFGPFETATVRLAGGSSDASCLGFRHAPDGPHAPLSITGLACVSAGVMERAALACTLDRLDLVSAGDDDDLQRVFVEAERGRARSCERQHDADTARTADPSAPSYPATLKQSL